MNITIISILTTISILFSMINASGQTCPNKALQRQMQTEETAFLANMKPGLQHTQMLAVRDAMKGDYSALEQIRQSRNQAPVLPETVESKYVTPDICLFSPVNATERKRPLLLYLHGGGWCFGSINSCARFCAALAEAGDCCVAALNYRLAPKYPFPMPLNDCIEAFEYLKQHAEEWGCDSSRISIGGDSAGGNLALAASMSLTGVHKVIPIYPVTKLFTEVTSSWKEYARGYGDDAELPPVLIISAGHDILFDQTAELARRLQHLGHPLSYHVFPTATHLFITVPGQPTAFQESVRIVSRFLNE